MKKSSSDDDLTKREMKENDFKPSDMKSGGSDGKEEMKSTRNDQEREHEVKEDSGDRRL